MVSCIYACFFAWFGISNVKHSLILSSGASPPTNVIAVQEGPTSIRVSWTPSSDATGYIISYTGGSSGSVTVSDGSTEERLLSNLVNGGIYTISIMATSTGLSSGSVVVMDVRLRKYHENTMDIYIPHMYNSCTCTCSSWPANHRHESNSHSHLHLPLLECSQWLSGDQL